MYKLLQGVWRSSQACVGTQQTVSIRKTLHTPVTIGASQGAGLVRVGVARGQARGLAV